MLGAAILWIGLGATGAGEYLRPLGSKAFDQAALDAEGFGDKKSLAREDDGLRVTLKPGEAEAGWKTPAGMQVGGDCTITATLVIRKLPKPGQEDGAAIGLAIATQNVDQPEATLLREIEPDGKDVYRPVDKGADASQAMNQRVMFDRFGDELPNKKGKPARHTFPARGEAIRLEFRRQGETVRYQVSDAVSAKPREIGQFKLGSGDIAGVKLFASNRNGAEPVDVQFQDVTIHADRIGGLGTAIRTIFGTVVHGDPTGLDAGTLVVGPTTPGQVASPEVGPASAAATGVVIVDGEETVVIARAAAGIAAPANPISVAVAEPKKPDPPKTPDQPAAPEAKPADAKPAEPAKPKARIPLDEVESITFERSATLAARFLGQPNVDTTGPGGDLAAKDARVEPEKKPAAGDDLAAPPPGTVPPPKLPKVEPKPNGIRDIHLALSSLRDSAIKQIQIQCPTDKGQATWRLDTSGSKDWPISLQRAGSETWADLFLEPPEGDCHDKQFAINLTYADGQNAQVQLKATEHTDPKKAFDPDAPTPALDARVYLAGDEQLFGKLEAITEDALTLMTPWGDKLDVPMSRVAGVYMGMPDHKESPEAFAKRLKTRGGEDLLLARAKDGEVVAIAGVVEEAKGNKLTFNYQDKARTLPLKQVEGFVLAARPAPKPPEGVRMTFALAGGIVVSGRWDAVEAASWKVETPWGQALKLPATEVRTVRSRGGQMAYLSDLEPSRVEETPYFGRRVPYRRDVDLAGGPLRLDGQAIEKGLAVHSRTALTYDLEGKFATFETLVGFDDAGRKKGRVDCRVLADGKEIYANPDLRADAPPVKLSLPVAGAEQLQLVVDFGPDEDTGDRVIWANARLFRRSSAAPATPTTPPASRP